ncbi:hypothetical protein PL321_15715 [Caloramator sp. mosi_1]|nr:hypothetical protein [Caloramator sp. mosi_1]WDC83885.1 hypothetical protein PL321_15715 [Caloramator sp. mosi_1]
MNFTKNQKIGLYALFLIMLIVGSIKYYSIKAGNNDIAVIKSEDNCKKR